MPFLLGYLHLDTIAVCLLLTIGRGETGYARFILISWKHEVKRCNITRHSNIAIIGEDGGQALGLFGRRRHIGMTHTR